MKFGITHRILLRSFARSAGFLSLILAYSVSASGDGARLLVSEYTFHRGDRKFEIGRHVSLSSTWKYTLVFSPEVLASEGGDGGPAHEMVWGGTLFRIRGVVFDGPKPAEGFLSGFDLRSVADSAGQVKIEVLIGADVLRQIQLSGELQLHLEIVAEGKMGRLPPVRLSGFFPRLGDVADGSFKLSEEKSSGSSFETIIKTAKAEAFPYGDRQTFYNPPSGEESHPLDLFVRYWRGKLPLLKVSVGSGSELPGWLEWKEWAKHWHSSYFLRTEAKVEALLESARPDKPSLQRMLSDLCWLYRDPSIQELCRRDPEIHFQASEFWAIEQKKRIRPLSQSLGHSTLMLQATFFTDKGHLERWQEGARVTLSASTGSVTKYLGFEQFGNGAGFQSSIFLDKQSYSAQEVSLGQETKTRVSMTDARLLGVDEVALSFSAMARRCLLVRPLFKTGSSSLPGVLFCSGPKKREISESWYEIRDIQVQPSTLRDPNIASERGIEKLIRGRDAFDNFRRAIGDATRGFILKTVRPLGGGVDTVWGKDIDPRATSHDGGLFPGIVGFAQDRRADWSETQVGALTRACSLPAEKNGRLASFCDCYFRIASTRFEWTEYRAHSIEADRQLEQMGARPYCLWLARESGR